MMPDFAPPLAFNGNFYVKKGFAGLKQLIFR